MQSFYHTSRTIWLSNAAPAGKPACPFGVFMNEEPVSLQAAAGPKDESEAGFLSAQKE
jgi:hypothetical protein